MLTNSMEVKFCSKLLFIKRMQVTAVLTPLDNVIFIYIEKWIILLTDSLTKYLLFIKGHSENHGEAELNTRTLIHAAFPIQPLLMLLGKQQPNSPVPRLLPCVGTQERLLVPISRLAQLRQPQWTKRWKISLSLSDSNYYKQAKQGTCLASYYTLSHIRVPQ